MSKEVMEGVMMSSSATLRHDIRARSEHYKYLPAPRV